MTFAKDLVRILFGTALIAAFFVIAPIRSFSSGAANSQPRLSAASADRATEMAFVSQSNLIPHGTRYQGTSDHLMRHQ